MDKINLVVILGTDRENRESEKAAKFILNILKDRKEFEVEYVDPREFKITQETVKIPKFSEITAKADALLIVTPEYNHGFPGTLKTLMDTEYPNYMHKAAAIAGVSDGPWGGVRAIELLIPYLKAVGLSIARYDMQFPFAPKLFDENNQISDDSYTKRTNSMLDELLWVARAMKWGRENLK